MIPKSKHLVLSAILISSLLCSCINKDYDLSDIDTTARVEVKELTVPMNIEDITLNKIIDLSSDSKIKEVVDPVTGQKVYAVVTDGTFESSEINIPSIKTSQPSINPIASTVSLEKINKELDQKLQNIEQQAKAAYMAAGYSESQVSAMVKKNESTYKTQVWNAAKAEVGSNTLALYSFPEKTTTFVNKTANVDKAIRSISDIKTQLTMSASLVVSNLNDVITNINLKNLKLQLPKGLTLTTSRGTYDKTTGILDMSGTITIHQGKNDIVTLNVTQIDPVAAGVVLTTKDDAAGTFEFTGNATLLSGDIYISYDDFADGKTFFDLPSSIDYSCQPVVSEIVVNKISGEVKYDITGVDIDPVVLNDIPEFLASEKTDLKVSNPQVYLNVNNPMEKYGVYAQTGLKIYGQKNGVNRQAYEPDDKIVTIDAKDNTFCVSPTQPSKYYTGFDNARFIKFTGMKNILSGDGIPSSVCLEVLNPCIPLQKISDLDLGTTIDKVVGKYTLYAPLSFDDGSVIVYNKTVDGWSGDMDKVTITSMKVTATMTTDIPLEATLTLTALDADGKDISATFSEAHLEANASGQSFVFEQTSGIVKNLDGIRFTATVVSKDASKALAPVSTIKIANLKVTVSGYYDDKL